MRILLSKSSNRKVIENRLIECSFDYAGDIYVYEKYIVDDSFKVKVVYDNGKLLSYLYDTQTDDEYVLVDANVAIGKYTASIKTEYENVLDDIINKCTTLDIYRNKQSKRLLKYIEDKYDVYPEFLWKKFPKYSIVRASNSKWFCVFMIIPENKIGLSSDKLVEVIDIKVETGRINSLIDNRSIFTGYHMNKNHWITIILDGSINDDDLFALVDNSYNIVS